MSAQNEHAFLAYVNRQSRVRKSSAAVHERVGIVSVGALGADDILVVAAHQLCERWREEIDSCVLEHGHEFECNSECDLCDSPNFEW